jgi:hypothetical protein
VSAIKVPDIFRFNGPAEDNPLIEGERFHVWAQQDRYDRIPFPVLPWPSPERMEALMEAVGWTQMRTARNFGVPGNVLHQWLSNDRPPTSGNGDYYVPGAQAGWSALAYAVEAAKPKPKRSRAKVEAGADA